MKNLTIFGLLAVLGLVGFAGSAGAQVPDCTGEGPDRLGLVWEDGSFTMYPHNYTPHSATLFLFNPTVEYITAWELRLDYALANLNVMNVSLRGSALNVGDNGNFIVGLGEPLLPDPSGAVALADFTFLSSTSDVVDIFANPLADSLATFPGQMVYMAPGYASTDTFVTIFPIGGVDEPVGNIDDMWGVELPYCPQPNQAPTAVADQVYINEDESIIINIVSNDDDPDGYLDLASVQLTGPPTGGGSFTYNGDGTVTYTPLPEFSGLDTINYTIADNEGLISNSAVIIVIITAVQDPPVVTDIPDQTILEGENFAQISLDDFVSDAESSDAEIAWGYSGNTELIVNITNRVATISAPDENWFGNETITFTATDENGAGLSDSNYATFTVTGVNDPPVVADIPDQFINEGDFFATINLDDFVIDIESLDTEIAWSYSGNTDLAVDITDRIATVTVPDENWYGSEIITFTATDENGTGLSSDDPATFNVSSVNDPPVVADIPDQSIAEGGVFASINLDDYVSDIESLDTEIAWGFYDNINLAVDITDRVATITAIDENWNGSETITFTAMDQNGIGGLEASDAATFTITAVNDPPVVTDIPDQTILEGENFAQISLDDFVSDVESYDYEIVWSFSGNIDFVVDIDLPTRIATITPPSAWVGSEQITFTATDESGTGLSASDAATFTVNSGNTAPVLADLGAASVPVGTLEIPLHLDDFLTDEETAAELTWAVNGDNDVNVFWSNGVAYIRTKIPAWFGTTTITFTATDSGGLSDSADFTVTWEHEFQEHVEILVDGLQTFYAGTRTGNPEEFDPIRTQLISSTEPALVFEDRPGMENYAYVRHMLAGNETYVTSTRVDDVYYDLYYGEYRALPTGDFCFLECVWNDDTEQDDCADDCQFELVPGNFYSLIWTPGGPAGNMSLIEETDQVWLRTDPRPVYDATQQVETWNFQVESANNGPSPITRTLDFAPSFLETDGIELNLYDATADVMVDLWPDGTYSYDIPAQSGELRSFTLLVGPPEYADNNPPVLTDMGEITVPFGDQREEIDLSAFLTDEQPPEELLWSVTGDDDIRVNFAWGNAYITVADPAWFGTNVLTITATDSGGLSGSTTLIFTVTTGFDLYVEILENGQGGYFAGTALAATDNFDPPFDSIVSNGPPPLVFNEPPGMDEYAYVRHLWEDQSNETSAVLVNETIYWIGYNRFQAVPPGELGLWDGVDWIPQMDTEPGGFYTLVHTPGPGLGSLDLEEDTGEVWLTSETHPSFDVLNEVNRWDFQVTSTNNDIDPITRTIQFNPSFAEGDGIELKVYDATSGTLVDLWPTGEYNYEIPGYSAEVRSFTLFVGTPGSTGDTDGDGVPDDVDECPGEDASFFDRNGDGCIDPVIGGRHIEYWAEGTFPLAYYIHETGAPGIDDDSDLTAIQEGFEAWTEVIGTEIAVDYLGTTSDPIADAYDGISTVTFSDDEYPFPSGVIAVGLSTSYAEADHANGIRPGQIIDTDMIFNPSMTFRTDTAGPPDGTYIKGVVTHEAGHMLGLSHSGVQSSTMFYVLPSGAEAASLETEDRLAIYKAYYDQASYVGTSHLEGTVTDGLTGQPISGAIVYVITAATNDTLACDFTLPADGSYHFIGLPDGSYNLAIHPLNGSSNIGYLYPDNINPLIKGTADILFEPEFWDAGESNSDDPTVFSPVFVSAGATAEAHFITNIDLTGPTITAVSPPSGSTGVSIDSAILFRCDEAIDPGSLVGNFNFQAASGGDFLLGGATLVENGRTLAYTPTVNLEFNTEYLLEVGADLKDLYGNTMGSDFSTTFTTELQPQVAMSNLIPRKGVAGSILVINGAGFSGEIGGNAVTYGGVGWSVLNDAPSQLVVQVPDDAVPSTANIQVQAHGSLSNLLSYTVLPPGEEARGLETAAVDIFALPRQVEVSPDGDFVYIATDQGLGYVDVNDATAPVYGSLSLGNGLNDLDITPFGDRVYAISTSDRLLYRLSTDPVVELGSVSLDFRPLGLLVDPSGQRAYLATEYNEIQVWDIDEGSLNFLNQVGTLTTPNPNLLGTMATDPAGNFLLALDGAGQLLAFDLNTFQLEEEIPVLGSAREVVVDPLGERAYVTDETGNVSLVSLESFSRFLDIPTGGALQGVAVDPMGSFLYAVNHQLDNLDVIDLRQESPTYRTISARLPQQTNPVDVALSPDGLYAYVIVESDQRLVINTVGAGPMVSSLSRRSGPVGTKVVLAGVDFTGGTVSFNGIPAVIQRGDDTSLTATVPPGATSGTVMVLGDEPGEVSNGIRFEVLDSSPTGVLRFASSGQPEGVPDLTGALSLASNDRVLAVGGQDGRIHLQDVDPNSMDFSQFIGETSPLTGPVTDLVVAPDGLSVFAVTSASSEVALFNINPGSAAFEGLLTTVALDSASPEYLAVSPDGRYVLASDPVGNQVHVVNWADAASFATDLTTPPGRLAFHPEGQYAYALTGNEVVVLNLIPGDPDFGNTAGSLNVAGAAIDLAFGPDGSRCYVLTGAGDRSLVTLDTSNPVAPSTLGSVDISSTAAAMAERLVLSPAGDRALLNIRDDGLVLVDLLTGDFTIQPGLVSDESPLGFGFATDGSRVITATSADDLVSTFDFNSDQQISIVWGNDQTGQMNQPLSSSLRVRVADPVTGEGLDQVPVTFSIDTSGEVITKAPVKPVTLEKIPSFVPVKKSNHVGLNKGTPDGNKSGGELIDGAVTILTMPFTDSGNTSDNLDDYDESCPSVTPGAPDVVYSWTADFSGGITIDLCGSGYDTKLYVYEFTGDTSNPIEPGNPWACNDDYYDGTGGCGNYVSLIEDMYVNEGTTYYIVIDGWNGDSGDYVLNITKNYESSPWGFFVTDDPDAMPTHLTVGTDEFGFAEVNWSLGYYSSEQTVDVASIGATGSPLHFTATAVEDPVNLPFTVVESSFAPAAGATDVSVTTAIQIVFSRAIYTSSGIDENFFVSSDGGATPIDVVMGFASNNTAVSLTPREVLEYGTTYTVVVGETIYSDLPYMLLTNPQTFTFTTEDAPDGPTLTGISPPSGPELVPIMLSGTGFSPDLMQNQVFFGGVVAPVISAEPDFILTRVPLELGSGELLVQVTVEGQPTNPLPFTVLEPTLEGADEVVVRIPTGSATRSATVSPDGATIYAVAPESDLIIPIDLVNFTTLPSIPVGDMPWAISGHPDGDLVYVANRMSGDASVIDIDPDSPTYHQTISSVQVGAQPVDILVTPAGDRVLVANEESQDLAVIDGDPESSTFNAVVNRVPVASSVKTVTVTPDGARIYLGTDEGYILIGSVDYGVIRRVPTVSGVKSVTVSPDGALLVVVETNGIVNIYDIAEGSSTEDQVVARVPVASSVKTATVSPDGARLYAVMDEGDIINVYALDIGTSVGAIDAPNPRPVVELVFLQTLTAGENPQMVIFDPSGSGRFIVPNAGDNTVSVFDLDGESILRGRIFADCPSPETPIPGVEVDIYSNEIGELAQMVVTDENGAFEIALPSGPYTVTMMTPLGFAIEEEERSVTLSGGQTTVCEWALECETIIPRQRRMGWWKRQFAVALCGWGHAQVDGPTLCEYLDSISGHFNSNSINPVVIYQPPASGECQDKLEAARELLNFWGNWGIEARAKQQLLALLLNVASSRISLQEVISEDGANVSQAITYCDNLIDDGVASNDWTAWWIAFRINVGWMVPADTIPISLPNIFYSPVATHFHLDQNYPNPFNPECRIRFGVPKPGHVRLKIFDVGGRLVKTLVDEQLIIGTYIRVWDGTDNRGLPSASGVYFYKMEAGSFVQTRKMLLMK